MTYKQTRKVWNGAVDRFLEELRIAASKSGVNITSVVVEGGIFLSKISFKVSGTEDNVLLFMFDWTFK